MISGLKDGEILVPAHDHSYRVARIRCVKAVYNAMYKTYSEYFGDDYLIEGNTVIDAKVTE